MEQRICKKCLLREMADQQNIYESIRRMVDDLEPERKASPEIVEARLAACKQCERLFDGMCQACGCYVELRAATADLDCPYEHWPESEN